MSGPIPSENPVRRNKPKIAKTVVALGTQLAKTPDLPNSEHYSERTLIWYQTWRESEQAYTFTKTAWLTLHMLADLVEAYYKEPTASSWAQIKQTQSGLLALPAEQRRLNFKIEVPKIETVKSVRNVTNLDDRRERLLADGA